VQGVLEVPDRSAALAQIERLGLFPIVVDASKGGVVATTGKGAVEKRELSALLPPAIRNYLGRKRRPKLQELATFTQQLANLLSSGMPLTVALNSMTHLESKGISSDVSKQLKQDVMEGRSLSDSMAQQPHIFSDLYVNMVRAGEQSGALVEVLRRLADHFERFAEVQSKFTAALIYPAFVTAAGAIIMFLFMTKMLPTFMEIFTGMNIELPLPTRILIKISYIFSHFWWLMILTVMAIIFFIRRFQASEEGKRKIDEWKMNAPVFGKAVRLNLFGQFARTLATLLENGVPVLTALQITEQIVPNRVIKEAIARTRSDVTDGKTLAQPLARSKIFPQLMVDLVKIGEETGNVPGALQNIATTYESELSTALKVITSLIEPVMIIVMALMVAFLLVSILSAMFAMTSNIAK
jgi:type II secretory pathway component PulF